MKPTETPSVRFPWPDVVRICTFLSYCLQITLQQRLKALASGLTAKSVLEKFESMQMVDVILPTTEGKELRLPRYTEPSQEHALLLIWSDQSSRCI